MSFWIKMGKLLLWQIDLRRRGRGFLRNRQLGVERPQLCPLQDLVGTSWGPVFGMNLKWLGHFWSSEVSTCNFSRVWLDWFDHKFSEKIESVFAYERGGHPKPQQWFSRVFSHFLGLGTNLMPQSQTCTDQKFWGRAFAHLLVLMKEGAGTMYPKWLSLLTWHMFDGFEEWDLLLMAEILQVFDRYFIHNVPSVPHPFGARAGFFRRYQQRQTRKNRE